MMTPSLHFNGSSAESLNAAYREAYDSVFDAIAKVALTSPHGRDYYPQGDNAIVKAGAEHKARMTALKTILSDLESLTLATMK